VSYFINCRKRQCKCEFWLLWAILKRAFTSTHPPFEFFVLHWLNYVQSSADNRTPDNRKISITKHKYGRLSNIIGSISLLSRNLQLLYKVRFGLMTRYPDRISKLWYRALISGPDIKYSYSIRSDWSSGYWISGYRLKRQFDNRICPDISTWLYSISQLKYVRISRFSGHWASGYQHLTVYISIETSINQFYQSLFPDNVVTFICHKFIYSISCWSSKLFSSSSFSLEEDESKVFLALARRIL
jgi:hypothetical protein